MLSSDSRTELSTQESASIIMSSCSQNVEYVGKRFRIIKNKEKRQSGVCMAHRKEQALIFKWKNHRNKR